MQYPFEKVKYFPIVLLGSDNPESKITQTLQKEGRKGGWMDHRQMFHMN